MSKTTVQARHALLLLLALLTPAAHAQELGGDILVPVNEPGGSAIKFFGKDGVLHRELDQAGVPWTAAAWLSDGTLIVNNTNFMRSVEIFDHLGQHVRSFHYTPAYYASDLDVFSDGTIAICSRLEGILRFDQMGNSLPTIVVPGMTSANGLQVQGDDTVWIADRSGFNNHTDGRVWHVDRSGNVLHVFNTSFDPSDVAVAPDGSIWTSSTLGLLTRFHPDGAILGQFPAEIGGLDKTLHSLAVDDDGIIWASGYHDVMLRGYAVDGTVLHAFPIGLEPNSMFMTDLPGTTLVSPTCAGTASTCPCGNLAGTEEGCMNSTGRGATLESSGTTSASNDTLVLHAEGLAPGLLAIAFVGESTISNGPPAPGVPFGDGRRCAGGHLQRLGTRMVGADGSASWGRGLGNYGAWAAGDTRTFQVWYSDSQASPCSSAFNVTSALEAEFIF